jgi:photosystem II stability/assembly factor-like uncharacterized protein
MRCAALCLTAALAAAQTPDPRWLERLQWRNIGPASMGGRISDIAAPGGDSALIYVATASGGIFRSDNAGTTWKPIFDQESVLSLGAIALDARNPEILWAGTGEANLRNSVSFGNGVYRSADGGKTWRHLGLDGTGTIARVIAHPTNPDIAYVAAVGHPFGPNPERGVFATFDGGSTWQKTLFVDDAHGAADLEIDPSNPNVLYATLWHFDRKPWTFESGSERGGLFKSVDGGRTWTKLTQGLPTLAGRIGVKVAPSNPRVVYVIAESKEGVLFRSSDAGASFTGVNNERELVARGYYYADLRVDPLDENRVYALNNALFVSADGGKEFRRISPTTHGDFHALWIDPKNPRRLWQGTDGGLAVSHDRGATWEQVANLALGQFYHVYADTRPFFYQVIGGMQDNGSWIGPHRTREPAGILNDDWRMVNGFSGFGALSDPDQPDVILTEQMGGILLHTDLRTRDQQNVSAQPRSNAGGTPDRTRYRFNWNAPLVRSPHGKQTIYLGGNVLFQSADWGRSWEPISTDLTNNDRTKMTNSGGPIWIENSASEVYSTITAIAESPLKRGLIWTGTDDGNLQITRDGGRAWTNVAARLPGLPPGSPFCCVVASRTNPPTAYVGADRHMLDDFRPYVFRTTDGGSTWTNISGNLPDRAYLHVLQEDRKNPNLLYAGTELGLYVSWTGGSQWLPLSLGNLPNVPVNDLVIQEPQNDLIVATHGRSLWILDDAAPLQQLTADAAAHAAHLFPLRPAYRFAMRATRFGIGDKTFAAPNPPYGALITYYLDARAASPTLQILDSSGAVIRDLRNAPAEAGLNRVAWDLRYDAPAGPQALPGNYRVRLVADGNTSEQALELRLDPALTVNPSDLLEQFQYSRRLTSLQRQVTSALSRLSAAGKEHPDQIQTIATLRDPLARPPGAGRSETHPRLLENLQALYALVDGANAAPTSAMRRYFDELEAECTLALRKVNQFLPARLLPLRSTRSLRATRRPVAPCTEPHPAR